MSCFKFSLSQRFVISRRLVLAAVCVVVTVVGSCGTTISSNFWLQSFPNSSSSGQFAVELFAAISYFLFFSLLLLPAGKRYGWKVVRQSFFGARFRSSSFARRIGLLFCIGLNDIGTSILTFYAIPHTPEMLQALLQTTIPFFSLFLSFIFVSGEWARTKITPNLVGSFALMFGGLIVASWKSIASTTTGDHRSLDNLKTIGWVMIYVLSCAVYSGWCVAQRYYLDSCEGFAAACELPQDADCPVDVGAGRTTRNKSRKRYAVLATSDPSSSPLSVQEDDAVPSSLSTDAVGTNKNIPGDLQKLTMLVGDSFFTMILSVALLPIDVIPWFGTSPNVEASWQRFVSGLRFIFYNKCNNIVLGACYVGSELSTYLSCAYLNEYSPTLSSLVVQLAGPMTALLVIVFPALEPSASSGSGSSASGSKSNDDAGSSHSHAQRSTATLVEQVAGVVLVGIACWLYYRWEVETAGEGKSIVSSAANRAASGNGCLASSGATDADGVNADPPNNLRAE